MTPEPPASFPALPTNLDRRDDAPILWGYDGFWGRLALAERGRVVTRSLLDLRRVQAARARMRRIELREPGGAKEIAPGDMPLVLVVRNERDRLAPFLRHYRRLGVTSFYVVDDQSTDGTPDMLLEEPDVRLFVSNVRYGEAQLGELWREAVVDRIGRHRWYVNVDVDEYLVYDGMDRFPLPALVRELESMGLKRTLAAMVDMYAPGSIAETRFDPDREPWDVAPLFDGGHHTARYTRLGTVINGGVRARIFGRMGNRSKFPVVYWDDWTFCARSIHAPLPYWRNFGRPYAALLHFKLFSDLEQRSIEAIEDGQHFANAASYKAYHRILSESRHPLLHAASVAFTSPETLVQHGFMQPIPWRR